MTELEKGDLLIQVTA